MLLSPAALQGEGGTLLNKQTIGQNWQQNTIYTVSRSSRASSAADCPSGNFILSFLSDSTSMLLPDAVLTVLSLIFFFLTFSSNFLLCFHFLMYFLLDFLFQNFLVLNLYWLCSSLMEHKH